jgi:hypothetical protein
VQRNCFRVLALAALAAQLAACASLPKEQASGFKTLATGSEKAFAALSGAQAAALANEQLALVAQGRKFVAADPGCTGPDDLTAPCVLIIKERGSPNIAIGSQTPRLRKLLAGISLYATSMDDLAAAKDLDAAADATGKATASLKSLVAAAYPAGSPFVSAAVDGLAFGAEQLRVKQRRALMLRIATAADKVVPGAADALHDETTLLRASMLDVRKTRLRQALDALDTYNAKPAADPAKASAARAKLIAEVSVAATAVTQARAITTDFGALTRAHRLMLQALRNQHGDQTSGLRDAQAFQDALQTLTDLEPAAPKREKAAAGSDEEN